MQFKHGKVYYLNSFRLEKLEDLKNKGLPNKYTSTLQKDHVFYEIANIRVIV